MKFFRLIIFFLAIINTSCSKDEPIVTTGTIYGRITEDVSNEAIVAAQVSISDIQQSVSTGQDGIYQFSDITAGSYSITASKSGYLTDVKNITVVAGETTNGDFSLEKELPTITPNSVMLDNETTEETLQLQNTRTSPMNYTTQLSQDWLDVSPPNSTIEPLNTKLLTLTADLQNVPFGNYEETLIINVGQASLSVPITVNHNEPPNITITTPSEDQTFVMGEIMPISWNSNLEGNVKIELLRFSSVFITISEEETNNNGGSYSWEIPALEEEYYQLKITSIENEEVTDITEAFEIIEGPTKPTVVNGNVTELLSTSIKIEGEITDIGIQVSQVDQYGHVYSQNNTDPNISDFKTNLGSTVTPIGFESEITGLEPGVTYYVNAYATNSQGTSYGEVITVTPPAGAPIVTTTSVTEITSSSAVTGGNVTSDGGNNITERGICWGTTSPVNIDSNTIQDGQNTEGSYTIDLTGLTGGNLYYVRAYAINSEGTGYGDQISFTTLAVPPSVETISSSTIDTNSITVTGNVSDNGGSAINSHGFVYSSENSTPTLNDLSIEVGQDIEGQFQTQIENLQPSTNYFIRAYATNEAGTSYGNVISEQTAEGLYFNLISPTSSTTLNFGSNYTIQWETNYDNQEIAIQYFRDGEYISDIGVSTTASNSYSWNIGLEQLVTENNEHQIKIISNSNFEEIAVSDIFSVNKFFEIINPSTNSQNLSNSINISWFTNTSTPNDGATYHLELFKGTQLQGTISQNTIQYEAGSYSNSFSLDNFSLQEADDYRIKISDNYSDFYIISDYFEIISDTYTDPRDGNIYQLVQVGDQIWMAEDFRYTGISPLNQCGTPYNVLSDGSVVYHLAILTGCVSGNTVDWDANGETGTWNWMLSDNLNPIPEGWRVATNDDWMSLEINLGMDSSVAASWGYRISGNVGEKLKSTNFGGNNSSGFNVSEYINGNGYDSDCKRYLVNQAFIGNNGVGYSYRGFERDYDGILFNISFQDNNNGNPACDPQSDGNTNGPFFYHVRLVKDN